MSTIQAAIGLRRTPRILAAWLAVPVVMSVLLAAWLLLETCENSGLRELLSPDRSWKLVVFERSCSATVAWTTHVSVVAAEKMLPDAPGNLLVSFERHGSLIGSSMQEPEIRVRWRDSETIELLYRAGTPIESSVARLGRFRIIHTLTR
jgi:hypothetical protein